MELPKPGELVVGRIVEIHDHGVYVEIESSPYEGQRAYVFVSEVYPGRIKNIRHYVSINQRVVLRIRRVDPRSGYIEGSIKRVSERDKKRALKEFRMQRRLRGILMHLSKELNVSEEELEEKLLKPILKKRGNILKGLELIGSSGEKALRELGIPEERIPKVVETLGKLNVRRELYKERIRLELRSLAPDGVEKIKEAFQAVREVEMPEDVEVYMYTEGAPKYVIELKGTDAKELKRISSQIANAVIKRMRSLGGEGKILR